jgi:5-methylcytosine-specific restriction endonuclease McrA
VLDRVLDLAIKQLDKQRLGATDRPRRARRPTNPRTIPAEVRRAVWKRDGGQCTFVGSNGHRCAARSNLEFDHVDPVARGGRASLAGVRLLCRAHNQYAAECTFGAEFMSLKRDEARRAKADRRSRKAAVDAAKAAAKERAEEVVPWLRALGIRADHARKAAERCESIPHASLEERVKLALSCFGPRAPSRGPARANCCAP